MISIKESGNTIDAGINQAEVASRLGISRTLIGGVLGGIGIVPENECCGMKLYDCDVVDRLSGLLAEYPRRKGVRWSPPQDLLDKYNLP